MVAAAPRFLMSLEEDIPSLHPWGLQWTSYDSLARLAAQAHSYVKRCCSGITDGLGESMTCWWVGGTLVRKLATFVFRVSEAIWGVMNENADCL